MLDLKTMKNTNTQTGLVAFFDILGYQNLLERNEPEAIAEDVLPMLTDIGQTVSDALRRIVRKNEDDPVPDHIGSIIAGMNWLVFSDTVLLTLPLNDSDPRLRYFEFTTFFMACIGLQGALFMAGLPARGAIDFGKFFVKGTCFAGRTIVNAYRLSETLEIAACVLTDASATELRRTCEDYKADAIDDILGTLVLEYLIPTKMEERHMLTLMAHTYDLETPNIHRSTMSAFWGNNKDLPVLARQKVTNTEQWLEFLESRQEAERESNKAMDSDKE